MKRVKIFDTTLRDGEQSPGFTMNLSEKIMMAKQLEKLGVDVIEAGFAIASPDDFNAIKEISRAVTKTAVASLARTKKIDIDKAWEALQFAKKPRLHIFIATSDIHMKYKLKMSKEEVLKSAVEGVRYAKRFFEDIEFSAEDATRTEFKFLCEVVEAVIEEGATTINIPDTVGYTTPSEYYDLIKRLKDEVRGIEAVDLSVHCHDDLGFAVANSLTAVRAGATQIECTINGIGERAGNAALEEISMAIKTRQDIFEQTTNIKTHEIMKTSRLLTAITGVKVQPNKAIVGENAFAHESGIHQHGMLNNRMTYEIMTPESVGCSESKIVLGKHSGSFAFNERVKSMGYEMNEEELVSAYQRFIEVADKKKEVFDEDIEAIVQKEKVKIKGAYELDHFIINCGTTIMATSTVALKKGEQTIMEVAMGDGPVDASFKAIEKIVNLKFKLEDYKINSVTQGKDAIGETIVKIDHEGEIYKGRGISTDVIASSIQAYLEAVNRCIVTVEKGV